MTKKKKHYNTDKDYLTARSIQSHGYKCSQNCRLDKENCAIYDHCYKWKWQSQEAFQKHIDDFIENHEQLQRITEAEEMQEYANRVHKI